MQPEFSDRVAGLVAQMTISEKLAQLQGAWVGFADGGVVAPEMNTAGDDKPTFELVAADGLGHMSRVFGTKPVTPRQGVANLLEYQRWVAANTRCRIGLLAHEECLTGLTAWTATTFPTPLASAAAFDPELMAAIGDAIGSTMSRLGVHQGLAPVLDVVRDVRWGRVEETLGEDPYVVATLGLEYIKGIQSHGVLATAKHFAGYSGATAGRNLAPVHIGPRELQDVFLPPFEVAVRDGAVASIMPAYVEIDGVPMHASHALLTTLLRDEWGFTGTVLADYFAVAFLARQHGVAGCLADAAALALAAGVDVELPAGESFNDPALRAAIDDDPALAAAVDRAVARMLAQKESIGLLDIDAEIARLEKLLADAPASLDPPEHRAIAARAAAESVILLDNKGLLPLTDEAGLRIAVIGPNADRESAMFGCYSFMNHVLANNPGVDTCLEVETVASAIKTEFPSAAVTVVAGCDVSGDDRSGFPGAVAAAAAADVVVLVVGDQAGLFGRGTSGEGCDAESLELPGVQADLVREILAARTPVVLVAVTGRPYAIGELAARAAATLQVFFPGEMGGPAIAGVLSGRVNPSGHLPVSVPRSVAVLPYSYLHPVLGDANNVSAIDTTPQFCFGYGLSYTTFEYDAFSVSASAPTDGWIDADITVHNTGLVDGAHLVQLYGHDVVASVTRPTRQLLAYARVDVPAGSRRQVHLRVPVARFALTDVGGRRVVEPGAIEVWLGHDCDHPATDKVAVDLTGPVVAVTGETPRLAVVSAG